ncbi:MAG TPA: hypothetical protein DEA08_30180 [Planctomycetes bacterium]|nr:hypothetical protein [Planctomycetota bacterium]
MVRAALSRGYMTNPQLREALLMREELRKQGRAATTLQILGHRFLTPAQRDDLMAVYEAVKREAEASPIEGMSPVPGPPAPLPDAPAPLPGAPSPLPPAAQAPVAPAAPQVPQAPEAAEVPPAPAGTFEMGMLESSTDELAIPEFFNSSPLLARPPEEDPDEVQEFMRLSSEGLSLAEVEAAAKAEEAARVQGGGDLGLESDAMLDGLGEDEGEEEEEESASGLWRWVKGRLSRKK